MTRRPGFEVWLVTLIVGLVLGLMLWLAW